MRLDKYLADMGIGTRSESKKYIKGGRVSVNDTVITDGAFHVSNEDVVAFDGEAISYEEHVYYLLNKPQGVISATKDNSKKTILDLIKPEDKRKELFPVGRLDKDTEGLLIITNDGALAHQLLSPRHHVDKTYYAIVSGTMTDCDVEAFAQGMEIDKGDICLPAKLNILSTTCFNGLSEDYSSKIHTKNESLILPESPISEIEITICEGKYHQIKRMCLHLGHEVLFLKRRSMGPISLEEDLDLGLYRPLTKGEIKALQDCSAK